MESKYNDKKLVIDKKHVQALEEFGAMAGKMEASRQRILALVREQKLSLITSSRQESNDLEVDFPEDLANLHKLIEEELGD